MDLDVVRKVWSEQPRGYYSLSTKQGDNWKDHFFESIDEALEFAKKTGDRRNDLYWCITTLSEPRRQKYNVNPTKFLWQDLDEVDPKNLRGEAKPQIAWESSPGRYQALWRLPKTLDPIQAEQLNKQLAEATFADHGSWILTKVLRVPETRNHKYNGNPPGKLLWAHRGVTSFSGYSSSLDDTGLSADHSSEFDKVLMANRNRIPRKVLTLLLQDEKPRPGKRSDILWYMHHELIKAGLKPQEVLKLIKHSVWNKYKGRSDEDERLLNEVSKAIEGEIIDSDDEVEFKVTPEEVEETSPLILDIVTDRELMADMSQYPGWLVEGFWTRKSHGIVAGEPKSFKSTLTLDLAVSVASGKPFLGAYPVNEPGPVLIIQNENAGWIMKDRLSKIRNHKQLTGNVQKISPRVYDVTFARDVPIYYLNQQGFSLSDPFHKKWLLKVVQQLEPVLVILDPLYLMFDGDVSNAQELNPILTWLLRAKQEYDFSLMLIHHFRKTDAKRGGQRMLGSTTLHGWVESAWYLEVGNIVEDDNGGDEKDQSGLGDDINTAGAVAPITMEREFRGAGLYPKVDMTLNMGEFGDPFYHVEIARHVSGGSGHKIDQRDLQSSLLNFLSTKREPTTQRAMTEGLGVSAKVLRVAINELEEQGLLQKTPRGVLVRR